MSRPAVIFDLDGTLADTAADLIAAANACFRHRGLGDVLDRDRDAATALRGGRAMLRLGFERSGAGGAAEIEADYPRLLEHYGGAIDVHTRLYPGVAATLEDLRASGFALGICTNKPEALAETLVARLGVRDWFDSLVGADTLPVRKPDPAPLWAAIDRAGGLRDRAMLVGDTRTDHDTARAAGAASVLVTFGPNAGAVAPLGPDRLLEDFAALPALAVELLG